MSGMTINTHQSEAQGMFEDIKTQATLASVYMILHQSSRCLWTLDPTPQNNVALDLQKQKVVYPE